MKYEEIKRDGKRPLLIIKNETGNRNCQILVESKIEKSINKAKLPDNK
jgi:hypothetical protein